MPWQSRLKPRDPPSLSYATQGIGWSEATILHINQSDGPVSLVPTLRQVEKQAPLAGQAGVLDVGRQASRYWMEMLGACCGYPNPGLD